MRKIALAALLTALVATPALADNSGNFYIAGDLGSASYSNVNVTGGVNGTFPNPGVLRFAGGYHFSPQLAAEIGYSIFGDSVLQFPGGDLTLALRSFQVAAVGSLPLNPQFDLTGKLGLSQNNYTLKGSGNVTVVSGGSGSQSDLLIGFGAQYHVNQQFTIRAQFESFGKFQSGPSPIKATAFSLGGVLNF